MGTAQTAVPILAWRGRLSARAAANCPAGDCRFADDRVGECRHRGLIYARSKITIPRTRAFMRLPPDFRRPDEPRMGALRAKSGCGSRAAGMESLSWNGAGPQISEN